MSKIRELEFDIPIKTVSEANRREHWSERHKRRKQQRIDTAIMFKNALQGRTIGLPCIVYLTRIAPKKLDSDDNLNASMKAIRDQIAAALGVDDGDPRIKFEYGQEPIGRFEYNVRVRIKSVENSQLNSLK